MIGLLKCLMMIVSCLGNNWTLQNGEQSLPATSNSLTDKESQIRLIRFSNLKMAHYEPINNIRDWPLSPPLEGAGEIKMDIKLVTLFVDKYDVQSECFIFNEIHLYFSLVDVYMLTGMPVSGKPVLGSINKPEILFNRAFPSYQLGDENDISTKLDKGKIRTKWLVDTFLPMNVADVIEDTDLWNQYRKAYLLRFISSYSLSDASIGVVQVEYTTLMDDLDAVGEFAWGAAAHANMHDQLKNGLLNGLSYALVVFMFMHVPALQNVISVEAPQTQDEFPILLSWFERLRTPLKD